MRKRKPLFVIAGRFEVRPLHLAGALALAAILVAGILAIRYWLPSAYDRLEFTAKAVTVNDVPITPEAVDRQYAQLQSRLGELSARPDLARPGEEPVAVNKTGVLKAMIDQELLKQQAEKEGFEVTREEAQASFEGLLAGSAWSREEWEAKLGESGLTKEQFMDQYQENLAVSKLLEAHVPLASIAVSEKEVDQYIEANKDELGDLIEEGVIDDFRPAIQRRLMTQTYQGRVEDYLDSLRRGADIEVAQ